MSTAFAQPDREQDDHPDLHEAGRGQHGEDGREDHHHDLDREQRLPLGEHVGEDPGEQAEDHHRQELRGGDHAQPQRIAVGDRQHQPGLRDLLHPRPDQRDGLATEEEPVIAVAECRQRFGTDEAAWSEGRWTGHGRGSVPGCCPPPGCGSGPPSRLARCSSR
jgi:hypothetical protein